MLDLVNESDSVRDAAVRMAEAYGVERTRVEADLVTFCNDLLKRKLVVRGAAQGSSASASSSSTGP